MYKLQEALCKKLTYMKTAFQQVNFYSVVYGLNKQFMTFATEPVLFSTESNDLRIPNASVFCNGFTSLLSYASSPSRAFPFSSSIGSILSIQMILNLSQFL